MQFDTSDVRFAEQYFHIYNARLEALRPALIKNSQDRWGTEIKNVPLEQLSAALGDDEVYIIGTLFKLMPKQPSILKEDNVVISLNNADNFSSEEDSLILHEIDENVSIIGDIDPHSHVTGIPISLLGSQLEDGAKFKVSDICYAGPNLSVYRVSPKDSQNITSNERLLIISGLEFGFDTQVDRVRAKELITSLKKLVRFVMGEASGDEVNGFSGTKVTRIIIAGNSIAPGFTRTKAEITSSNQSKANIEALNTVIKVFDKFLFNLAQSGVQIELMPGSNDPTTFLLPQQPFHPKILPTSGVLTNVHPVTNPARFKFGNRELLGTSGENIDTIRQFTKIEYATTILKNTIEWGHICPSGPDNLSCVPFETYDPFVLTSTFDLYFAGNQPEYLSSTYYSDDKPKMQIISVPSFVKTNSGVLVDLKNLECEPIKF